MGRGRDDLHKVGLLGGDRQLGQPGLGPGEGGIEAPSGDRIALERLAGRLDLLLETGHEALALDPGRPNQLVPFATGGAAFFLGDPEGLRRPSLGLARLLQPVARLALGRPDRAQGGLERALRLGQARAGVGHDLAGQAQPFGDRERLAAAGQADRQVVGGTERLEVELDRGIAGGRRSCGRTP